MNVNGNGQRQEAPAIEVARAGGVTVVSLAGEHDMASAPEIEAALSATSDNGCGVVVDLSVAEFIDSAVVHRLFEAHDRLAGRGGRLVVQIGEEHSLRRVLELTSLTETVPVVAVRAEAVALAGGESPGQDRDGG